MERLKAKETSYSKAIRNDAILGIAPELTCDNSCNISKVVLKFNIADEFVDNELNLFPDEPDLQGLKRLTIFKYFEDMNMLLPIETKYDLENNTIYTEVDELGTYCIMDMEKWLANLGIGINEAEPILMSFEAEAVEDIAAEFNEESTRVEFSQETLAEINDGEDTLTEETFAPAMFVAQTRGAVTVQTPVDIAFLIQTSGQLEDTFNSQCKMIGNLMDSLIAQYGNGNVRFCLITYGLDGAKALEFTDGDIWFTNSMAVKMALSAQQYVYTSGYTDRGNAFKLLQNNVTFKETSAKFIFQVMNGSTNVGSMYFDQINTCAKLGINYSELMPAGYSYIDPSYGQQVDNAIKSTGGLNLTYGTNSESSVYNHIVENVAPPHVEFKAVLPTGWETISLVNVLDPNNGAKSDNDDLTDWEEVDTESGLITWDNNGNIQLPTFEQCLNKVHDQGFSYVLNEYNDSVPSYMHRYFYGVEILPIKSNPCEEDSDGDGLLDGEDPYKVRYNLYRNYDREKAIDYALKWYDGYNSFYYCYDNDCTNFVSQCLYAGGIPENEEWYSTRGEIDHLISGWFLSVLPSEFEINGEEYMLGYKGQNLLYKWDVSDAWNSVNDNRNHFDNFDYSEGLIKIPGTDNIAEAVASGDIQIGDIVYFDHEDDGIYEHAAVVSKVDDNMIYYAAHTDSYDYKPIKNYLNSTDEHESPTIIILKLRDKVIIQ